MVEPALRVTGLTKQYANGFTAVRELSLEIPDGALFGLLGPNGAGKTTLIAAITNLVRPTTGSIEVFGLDHQSRAARQLVGLAEQEINVDRFVTIRQALIYHGGYFGLSRREASRRADEALELFGLTSKAKVTAPRLSGGQKRRMVLARALVHRPRLLILDEPTAGVDVELRSEIWDLIRSLNAGGTTVLLTTHYLEEADALCDEFALIGGGRILDHGTPDTLRTTYGAGTIADIYRQVLSTAAAS